MVQLNIYNEIGLNDDPVFNKLSTLSTDNVLLLNGLEIKKNNQGWFEISNEEIHELRTDIQKCYEFINQLIINDERE